MSAAGDVHALRLYKDLCLKRTLMLIATSYPGFLRGFNILCALFCIPAGLGFYALWRFGRSL